MNKFVRNTVLFTLFANTVVLPNSWANNSQRPAQLVTIEQVKEARVKPTVWLPGNVVSRKNAPISAELDGQLLWVADIGDQVKKGNVIAKLDNRHLDLLLSQQFARVKQKQADVSYLKSQKQRLSALNQNNNTSKSELERISKDLTIAENDVIALELDVKQTNLLIEKSMIKAPFTGSISQRFAHIGEFVRIGRPLVQLVDTSNLDIKVAAPLSIAAYLNKEEQVTVKWQGNLLQLPIRAWSQAGDQISRSFDVRLNADNLPLISGSAVRVLLPKEKAEKSIIVPRDALVLRENETFVLTIDQNEQAKKVNVLVGQGSGDWIAVSGDIGIGEKVIIRGGERLSAGQKVRIADSYIAKK